MKICGSEDTVKEIVTIFLEDGPECVEHIADAIETENFKELKLYAHRLKGAARHVAAQQLSEKSYCLECAGDEEDIETAALLLDELRNEFEKVSSFLSRDDWVATAKQYEDGLTVKESAE